MNSYKINYSHEFESNGFVILDSVIESSILEKIENNCEEISSEKIGTRNLLNHAWCREVRQILTKNPAIKEILPSDSVAVQCTLFLKSEKANWSVRFHRDRFIPVARKFDVPGWKSWSVKEEVNYVQPPVHVLSQLIAVRLNLEDDNLESGALEVVPGSHKSEGNSDEARICLVKKGGVLVLRPLLKHASRKTRNNTRTVLHYLFGPKRLPPPAEWAIVS